MAVQLPIIIGGSLKLLDNPFMAFIFVEGLLLVDAAIVEAPVSSLIAFFHLDQLGIRFDGVVGSIISFVLSILSGHTVIVTSHQLLIIFPFLALAVFIFGKLVIAK